VLQFRGRSRNPGVFFVPVAATFIFFWYFSAHVDNLSYRIIFISLLSLLQISAIVVALLRNVPVSERRSYRLTGFAFILMALVMVNRLLEAFTLPFGQLSILYATAFRNAGNIATLAAVVLSSIGFVLMVRQRAEEEVRRKEEDLREAQRITHIGSWYWDTSTDATTGSDELLRIYGLDPTREGMPAFKEQDGRLYPHESWQKVNAGVQETLKTGVGSNSTWRRSVRGPRYGLRRAVKWYGMPTAGSLACVARFRISPSASR
jgi:PAS domain-containing protein